MVAGVAGQTLEKIEYGGSPIENFNGPAHYSCYREVLIVSVPFGYIRQWLWYPFLLISSSHDSVAAVQCCLPHLTFQLLSLLLGQA